jgi:hypothetical protein
MRENARATCFVTPDSVVTGQRNDAIALTNGGQVGRGLFEAGVLPRIWAALHSESLDQRDVFWSQEAHVRGDGRTEKTWQEVALIRWAHNAIKVITEDFSKDGLVHQVLLANLGEAAL